MLLVYQAKIGLEWLRKLLRYNVLAQAHRHHHHHYHHRHRKNKRRLLSDNTSTRKPMAISPKYHIIAFGFITLNAFTVCITYMINRWMYLTRRQSITSIRQTDYLIIVSYEIVWYKTLQCQTRAQDTHQIFSSIAINMQPAMHVSETLYKRPHMVMETKKKQHSNDIMQCD